MQDIATRAAIGGLMRGVWDDYIAIASTGNTPFTSIAPSQYELTTVTPGKTPNDLIDRIADVPVVLIIAADLSLISMMDKDLDRNRRLYLEVASIREYWIVDPLEDADRPALIVYRRRGTRWAPRRVVPSGGTYTTPMLPGFSLVLDSTGT